MVSLEVLDAELPDWEGARPWSDCGAQAGKGPGIVRGTLELETFPKLRRRASPVIPAGLTFASSLQAALFLL